MAITHVFFDLDKTLTASRSPMTPAHQELFERLCERMDVVVVSGGSQAQIREQVTPRFDGRYYTLAQSGNHAILRDGTELWNETLSQAQTDAVMRFIEKLKTHFDIAVADANDLVEHRGAQISYSVIGFHEAVEKKYAFDPDDAKRQAALRALAAERGELTAAGVEVVPAGTTTYNFYALGKHKGYNITRFIDHLHWSAPECLYVGDALFPGGNDETVIGVIPTHPVKDHNETFDYIARELLSS